MDQEILNRLLTAEKKIDAIYIAVNKTRKYILINAIITIVMLLLPILGALLFLPTVLNGLDAVTGNLSALDIEL